MSEFSQALECGIYKSGLTENQLAKISGFTRSYIALMKNGQRVSPDTVKLKKLLEALSLSIYEYENIWNAYLKARYGEDTYKMHMSAISFIESFGRISTISIKSDFFHDIPDINTINNRMDLEVFVKAVLEQEALTQDGYVRMIMQEDFSLLYTMLPSVCRSNNKLKVEHIICLEGADGDNVKNRIRNLEILKVLMPVFLAGNENGYDVYFYYDKIASHFASTALMPYMIMTSSYVVNISVDLEYAVVSRDKDTHCLFEQLFIQRKKSCRKMINKIPTGINIFEFYSQNRPHSDQIFTIGSQPCFGMFPVDSMVRNYFTDDNQDTMDMLLKVLEDNRRLYGGMKLVTSYFTKSGIRRLMEEGIVDELPKEIYTTLTPGDRRQLLKMLIHAIKSQTYEAYLLDDQKIIYPHQLLISAYSMTDVNVVYLSENTEARFALQEQSITRILYDFLNDVKETSETASVEDTLSYLESFLK
ncbi:MAG TPA: helix-turn-helix transcriptional regulator [Candidatus Scybalocola faecavium]|nr:helix-turn-helix transcriptional regulator [Candidatus Scybalocola faecavium]